MIKHILFDADQTLYPASSLVEKEMVKRMNIFVAEYLRISVEEARFLRANRDKKYNSTLEWLMEANELKDPEPFFSAVHPVDFENYFPKNPGLISLLSRTTVPCSIFTNSWKKHAENILEYLGISQFFSNIFDIASNNYLGKHHVSAFTNVLNFLDLEPQKVLYIDDNKQFTDVFHSLGGNAILVDESNEYEEIEYEKVFYIEEIELILKKYKVIKP